MRATVAVTDDGRGVAENVIALLNEAGASAVRAEQAAPDDVSATIFLGGLRQNADETALALEAFRVARTVSGRGAFVTVGRTDRGGPGALARTCAREWPNVAVKAVELAYEHTDAHDEASAIVHELLTGGAEPDIVLGADGSRRAWAMRSQDIASSMIDVLGPESVVVITGGARGVTAACARALAQKWRPRIALIGRTPLDDEPPQLRDAASEADLRAALVAQAVRTGDRPRPAVIEVELRRVLAVREIRETLAAIEAAGSPVRYLRADVGDRDSLRGAMEQVRAEWGPIGGAVHGAGVLADRLVADKTDENFERVMRVKAQGFANLLDLVEPDDPKLVCVFSSVVVSAGNPGQSDYAAANEIVERHAERWQTRHPDCTVRAIAWGPWNGGMVNPELAEAFAERNVPLIPLDAGTQAFVNELSQVEITGPTRAERNHDAAAALNRTSLTDETSPTDKTPPPNGTSPTYGTPVATETSSLARPGVRCLITARRALSPEIGLHPPLARGGEVAVSEVAQAWLADHRLNGRAIVPLAVVCDWMLRLVDAASPATLHDIHVVRGITAPAVVTIRRTGSDLTVEQFNADASAGTLCYRAQLGDCDGDCDGDSDSNANGRGLAVTSNFALSPDAASPPVSPITAPTLPLSTLHGAEIYDGETLFHGSALRTLTHIRRIGPGGAVGSVVGVAAMEWPEEPWRIDPAALDGAIQLAVVWAKTQIGCATLPMSVRTGRFFDQGPYGQRHPRARPPHALNCDVQAVRVAGESAVCDVRLTAPDRTVLVELLGLELITRPLSAGS